jgi:peptidoglycan/xylan/chitin deacetylase (PgdA/CDA1 family)
MEKNPSFAMTCTRDGHEIAAHGWRWLDLWDMTLEEDEENIIKTLTSLEKSTGEFPVGYYFGRGTPNTKALFPAVYKKLGKELLHSSEAYNDDLPYWIDLPAEKDLPDEEKKGMLIVPYVYDTNGRFRTSLSYNQ